MSVTAPEREASAIVDSIVRLLPRYLDGKSAIIEMRAEGSRNWRQMEWIGFWFEHFFDTTVQPEVGGELGPRFGNTTFDLQCDFVWDLKAHPTGSNWLILNDCEAIRTCIEAAPGLGFIVVSGKATYDESGEFKGWHDAYKGGKSQYEFERIERGAPSRRRKSAFTPQKVDAFYIPDLETLDGGVRDGWMGYFQKDMRNSDGSPRRAKFQVNPDAAPSAVRVASVRFG